MMSISPGKNGRSASVRNQYLIDEVFLQFAYGDGPFEAASNCKVETAALPVFEALPDSGDMTVGTVDGVS